MSVDFQVENNGPLLIRFVGVHHSCSCTDSSMDALILEPRQSTLLHMQMNLHGRMGPQRFTNRAELEGGGYWDYEVTTTIYDSAKLDALVYSFGLVDPEQSASKEGTYTAFAFEESDLPATVSFQVDSERLQVTSLESRIEQLDDGVWARHFPFRLNLKPPAFPGIGQATLVAKALDRSGKEQVVRASCPWNTRSLYEVMPPQVFFAIPDRDDAGSIERVIEVRRVDGQALHIRSVAKAHPAIECLIERGESQATGRLRIRIDAKQFADSMWCELKLETDLPVQPRLSIPVSALKQKQ